MNVRFHIDRIVVGGLALARHDIPRFEAALRSELAAQFGAQPSRSYTGSASMHRLAAGPLPLAPGSNATTLGTDLARLLHRVLAQRDPQ